MRITPTLCLVLSLCSCEEVTEHVKDSIFGYYQSKGLTIIGYSGIRLNSDSTYFYSSGMCLGSFVDTGSFTFKNDTLLFRSHLESDVDTSNHGHHQIEPLTGAKYLLRNDSIYFYLFNGSYDTSAYWVRDSI